MERNTVIRKQRFRNSCIAAKNVPVSQPLLGSSKALFLYKSPTHHEHWSQDRIIHCTCSSESRFRCQLPYSLGIILVFIELPNWILQSYCCCFDTPRVATRSNAALQLHCSLCQGHSSSGADSPLSMEHGSLRLCIVISTRENNSQRVLLKMFELMRIVQPLRKLRGSYEKVLVGLVY